MTHRTSQVSGYANSWGTFRRHDGGHLWAWKQLAGSHWSLSPYPTITTTECTKLPLLLPHLPAPVAQCKPSSSWRPSLTTPGPSTLFLQLLSECPGLMKILILYALSAYESFSFTERCLGNLYIYSNFMPILIPHAHCTESLQIADTETEAAT